MKAILEVTFKKILGINVDARMIDENPKLIGHTEDAIKRLCNSVEEYFKDHNIKVITKFKVEK